MRELTDHTSCKACSAICEKGLKPGLQRAIDLLRREALSYPGAEGSGALRAGLTILSSEMKRLDP